jgi:hypothetical protein
MRMDIEKEYLKYTSETGWAESSIFIELKTFCHSVIFSCMSLNSFSTEAILVSSLSVSFTSLFIQSEFERFSGVKVDAPGVKVDAPGVKVDAPGVKVDAPGVKVDAPGMLVM